MNYKFVSIEKKKNCGIITYRSDKKQKLLTIDGMREILSAMEECRKDSFCKALIFTGWEEYFCMGGFLGDYSRQGAEEIISFADILTKLHRHMSRYPKPTIAAVNGHTGGGGLSFLEAFDLALSVSWAEFSLPEICNGLAPMISLIGVRNYCSRKTCMEMAGLGRKLSASEALKEGMINRIVQGNVLEEAMIYAERITEGNMDAFGVCKQYYAATSGLSYEQQLEIGKQYLVTMLKDSRRL